MANDVVQEFRSVESSDGKRDYIGNTRFRLRVYICSFISMLIVVSTATSLIILIINYSAFRAQKYEMAEGDMRIVSVSTAFCEGISLGKDSSTRKLWILSSSNISPVPRQSNMSVQVFVSRLKYWYKGFYLLEGSSIRINAVSDSGVKLYIFRGQERLNEWLQQLDSSNEENTVDVESNNDKSSYTTKISYVLSILETGNYYILLRHMRGTKDLAKLRINLSVFRKVYDVNSSVYSCTAPSHDSCSARLLFGSSEIGVIEVTGSNDSSYLRNSLVCTWRCEPRIWFYLAVFVGFILMSLVASLVFYFIFINRKGRKYNQLVRLASQKPQREACAARTASVACNRSNSFANRSLNGSIRRPPSRTPSTRSLSNHNGMSRAPRLKPVVTQMYTGTLTSEESGHETDEEQKRTQSNNQSQYTSSVESVPIARRNRVSRQPSFSTFQSSEDESRDVGNSVSRAHPTYEALHDGIDGLRNLTDRSRKHSLDTLYDRHGVCENISNGKVPNGFLARHHSSDDLRQAPFTHHKTCGKVPNGTIPTGVSKRRYSSEDHCDLVSQTFPVRLKTGDKISNGAAAPPGFSALRRSNSDEHCCSATPSHIAEMREGDANRALPNAAPIRRYSSDGHFDRECVGDRPGTRGNIPNGRVPTGFTSARRHSSGDQCGDRVNKTLPRNRGKLTPVEFHSQLSPEFYLLPNRPASLVSLQRQDGAWGNPIDKAPPCKPLLEGSDRNPRLGRQDESVALPEVKLRTHSGRRKESSWAPRLSMVSEV